MNSEITIVIPVREGSSRISKKVLQPFSDSWNLTEWKINQLLSFHDPDKIVLSSNSLNIKGIAKNMGVVYHERDKYLTDGHKASFSEVIMGIVKDIPSDHFAWITVVVPFMNPAQYMSAFETYRREVIDERNNDSLVSVNLLKEYLWSDEGPINYEANRYHTISQDLPDIYRVTNGIYMRDKASTLNDGYFLGKNPVKFQVPKIAGIDIDEIEDLDIAKALFPLYSEGK